MIGKISLGTSGARRRRPRTDPAAETSRCSCPKFTPRARSMRDGEGDQSRLRDGREEAKSKPVNLESLGGS